MKQQVKNYLILIILLAVLVAPSFALAAWWNPMSWGFWNSLFHRQTPNTQQTSNWKTYTNTDYGFQINYPPSVTIEKPMAGKGINLKYKNSTVEVCKDDGTSACGNFPGVAASEAQKISRNITISGLKYTMSGFILNIDGSESLILGLRENTYIYLNIPGPQSTESTNTETKLLQVVSTFKFTRADNSTANWKTYTNSQYGFQIKYPESATLKKISAPIVFAANLPIAEAGMGTNIDGKSVEIIVTNQSSCTESLHNGNPSNQSKVIINGIKFTKETDGEGAMGHGYRYIDYLTENNDFCTEISFTISGFNDLHIPEYSGGKAFVQYDFTKEEPLLNQILSTFKFITPVVNWENYDTGNGFSFSYPQNWGKPTEFSLPTRSTIAFPNGDIGKYDNGFFIEIGSFYAQEGSPFYQNGHPKALGIEELVYSIKNDPHVNNFTQQNVTVSGKPGVEIKYNDNATITEVYVNMDSKGNILHITSSSNAVAENIFNQILSTFKFTPVK